MTVLDEGGSAAEARYGLPRLGEPAPAGVRGCDDPRHGPAH